MSSASVKRGHILFGSCELLVQEPDSLFGTLNTSQGCNFMYLSVGCVACARLYPRCGVEADLRYR